MRYHEINAEIDFGKDYSWKATLALPVDREDWAEWRKVIRDFGVDLLLRIDQLADPDAKILTVGCPSKQVADALDAAWAKHIREKAEEQRRASARERVNAR